MYKKYTLEKKKPRNKKPLHSHKKCVLFIAISILSTVKNYARINDSKIN